ncbi:CinA family protein [Polynucleobacter alcilacus]|uniref:CinA family protein n=1 Tax=Polynucleobacter alcilacus TaxID=1819739 RepID=UPI001C0D3478|nr:CinA family protein [Polynucleobacter alcilacus]MBU3568071.1 CinA family protein [Polynucleobacter alcilacus]
MSLADQTQTIAKLFISKGWTIALAESCTGGLVCAALTELPGSSDWFERGYIAYSNQAKSECLGVPVELIESFGAVSEPVAKAMAEGAQRNAGANVGASITGIAGPTGGSPGKPVGTVCFSWTIPSGAGEFVTHTKTKLFSGDRRAVRQQATEYVLTELLALLNDH